MSHSLKIYKKFYELPPALRDIVHVSPLLEKASGTDNPENNSSDSTSAEEVDEEFLYLLDREELTEASNSLADQEEPEREIELATPQAETSRGLSSEGNI